MGIKKQIKKLKWLGAGTLVVLAAGWAPTPTNAADPFVLVPPAMASVGDSLSSGFSCVTDCAWTTGADVRSHASRLVALRPDVASLNVAQPGVPVAAFESQAHAVVANRPDAGYVTVLFGGNDLCNPTSGLPTTAAQFRTRFSAGLRVLQQGLPGVRVLVVSLPDLQSMQEAMLAAGRPGTSIYCSRYFANPGSTARADRQRRAQVLSELRTFNTIMAEECRKVVGCKWDGGALFRHRWISDEISNDGIHPTVQGQEMVAAVTWSAGFNWRG